MTFVGWSQIAIVLALTLIAAIPLSGLIVKIYAGEANLLTPALRPVERVFYRLAGVDETGEQRRPPFSRRRSPNRPGKSSPMIRPQPPSPPFESRQRQAAKDVA
jgi:hypothetical protein